MDLIALKMIKNMEEELKSINGWSGNFCGYNIGESDGKYIIRINMNGVPKEMIRLDEKKGVLVISGERRWENKNKNKTSEGVNRFMKSIKLPEDGNLDTMNAKYKNGILTVTMVKN
jgi:HSP20 family protein